MATPGRRSSQSSPSPWSKPRLLLAKDVGSAAACVNNVVAVQLSQEEFDALVDFVFNLGAGSFEGSTLLRDLNAADFASAAAQSTRGITPVELWWLVCCAAAGGNRAFR